MERRSNVRPLFVDALHPCQLVATTQTQTRLGNGVEDPREMMVHDVVGLAMRHEQVAPELPSGLEESIPAGVVFDQGRLDELTDRVIDAVPVDGAGASDAFRRIER